MSLGSLREISLTTLSIRELRLLGLPPSGAELSAANPLLDAFLNFPQGSLVQATGKIEVCFYRRWVAGQHGCFVGWAVTKTKNHPLDHLNGC